MKRKILWLTEDTPLEISAIDDASGTITVRDGDGRCAALPARVRWRWVIWPAIKRWLRICPDCGAPYWWPPRDRHQDCIPF